MFLLGRAGLELSWFSQLAARDRPNSGRAGRRRAAKLGRLQQLPPQVIDIEDQEGFRIYTPEFLENPLLPSLGEIGFRVHVLSKKSVLVRHGLKIQNGGDHIEVGNQDRLRQV